MTTVACGHPIKVYKIMRKGMPPAIVFNGGWNFVKVGPYDGYLQRKYLSSRRVPCFQDKYPKFFENFDLDLSELYYWGRLYDLYVNGKSKVR